MKKILLGLVIGCMMFGLIACGTSQNKEDGKTSETSDGTTNNSEMTSEKESEMEEFTMEALATAEETPAEDFSYLSVDGQVFITGYEGNSEIVVVPDEIDGLPVVEIAKTAFRNNEGLQAIKIGANVKNIGDYAFANCVTLKYVLFGKSVEVVEEYAFVGCGNVIQIELNDGLQKIGRMAFCTTEVPLLVPKSVTLIEDGGVRSPVQVYAGSYAEGYVKDYAAGYGEGFIYEIIE